MKDLSGWNKTGLNNLLNQLNINHPVKNQNQLNKSFMEKSLEEETTQFLLYAYYDVECLSKCLEKMKNFLNQILKECYEIPEKNHFQSSNEIPSTSGSLIEKIFLKFLEKQFGEEYPKFKELNQKIGMTTKEIIGQKKEKVKEKELISSFLNGAGINSLGRLFSNNSGLLNCLIQGGRCMNERNEFFQGEKIADVDMASCYGTAISNFDYPLGLPRVFARTKDSPICLLKEFLNKYQDELVENLYTITVSGDLDFIQTLIYSKIVNTELLQKKIHLLMIDEEDIEKDDLNGDFLIMLKQIENGIFTSEMLKVLKNICSNIEMNQILNLNVETACYYQKSDFVEFEDFLNQIEGNLGKYYYDEKTLNNNDQRTRKWTKIPLKKFVDPLINQRNELKKLKKIYAKDSEDFLKVEAEDKMLKLIVNGLYGILCSSFFQIGNVVLANNITAKARVGVWMLSRSVNGYQSITDGCTFAVEEVFFLKEEEKKKPSLEALSFLDQLKNHRCIRVGKLAEKTWEDFLQEKNMENCINEHVRQFWNRYGLEYPYKLEMKDEHFGKKIVYFKAAHYMILNFQNKIIFKCRNVRVPKDVNIIDEQTSTIQIIMNALITEKANEMCMYDTNHTNFRISTIHDYFLSLKRNQKDPEIPIVLPGSDIYEIRKFLFSANEFFPVNKKMYLKMRREKKNYSDILTKSDLKASFKKMFRKRQKDYLNTFNSFL